MPCFLFVGPGIFPEGPMISVLSVRPSVRPQRIFSKSDEPNFLKFCIQPLLGKSKRMSKTFFDLQYNFLAIFAVFWSLKLF